VRDTEGEFEGAEFRDEKTKLMLAYDYKNRYTLRVWGSTFKPALVKELKRLGVRIMDRTEATALLIARDFAETPGVDVNEESDSLHGVDANEQSGSLHGADRKNESRSLRGAGAMGMDVHTGKFYIFRAKATVLAMSRPSRVWLFDADCTGLCEFRPMQSIGSGHAMGWRAGMEFTMMEKSVRAEFSAAGRSFPPYGAGNNHNTWYAATMVDARGVEIPYVDRDGKELKTVSERYYPAKGQKFFLKGGVIDNPKYEYRGPETLDFEELMKRGYQLPFYADLSKMPDTERRVIWGMMVGEEAKTKIPIYQNYTDRGFDPKKHMLQSYGTGWQSANFLEQERQFFGAPGGVMHDWDLKTNIDGVYAAGDQLYASDCAGFACATGHYAGRKAADYAAQAELAPVSQADIEAEQKRLYAPLYADRENGIGWKELNMAIAKAMQNYCGGTKCEALLMEGLDLLESLEREIVPRLTASNPHELMRTHEVLDILTVAQIVLHASLARHSSSAPLYFVRSDYPEMDPEQDRRHIVIRQENGNVKTRSVPLDFFGNLKEEYEKHNQDYIKRDIEASPRESSAAGRPSSFKNASHGAGTQEKSGCENREGYIPPCQNKESFMAAPVAFTAVPVPCSVNPIKYDEKLCIGCGRCAQVCQCDVLLPSPEKGQHPTVTYPGECYYCGACVMVCPRPGAIRLEHPLMNQAKFVPVK